MLIDIQNSIKAAESKGYEQWAKIHNLKQAARNGGKLKKKVKQYDTIKQNVDSILQQAKQPEREKETER